MTYVALGLLEWVSMLASAALSVVVPCRGVLDFILRVALGSRLITFFNPLGGPPQKGQSPLLLSGM